MIQVRFFPHHTLNDSKPEEVKRADLVIEPEILCT